MVGSGNPNPRIESLAAIEIMLPELRQARADVAGQDGDRARFVEGCLSWTVAKGERALSLSDAIGCSGVREVEKTILGEVLRCLEIMGRSGDLHGALVERLERCMMLRVEDDATLLDPAAAVGEMIGGEWSSVGSLPGAAARRMASGVRIAVLPPARRGGGWTALLGPLGLGEYPSDTEARDRAEAVHGRIFERIPSCREPA